MDMRQRMEASHCAREHRRGWFAFILQTTTPGKAAGRLLRCHFALTVPGAVSKIKKRSQHGEPGPNSSRSKTWQPFIRADQLLYLIASRRQAACSVLLRPIGDAASFFPAKAADRVPLSGLASKARGRSRDEGREQEPEPPKEMEPKDPKRPPMGDLGHSSRITGQAHLFYMLLLPHSGSYH